MNREYCKFQNTLNDLIDVRDCCDDRDLSEAENQARIELINTCIEIADNYKDMNEPEDVEKHYMEVN